jgi:hypothetical protein
MKKHINKKNSKKNRRKTNKKGCGCKSNIFFTMKKRIVGGNINPSSFQNFETTQNQYYYDVNTHNNDPNNSAFLVSSRNLPNFIGGKKRKTKKMRKPKMRKMKGGDLLLGSSNNALTTFGNYDGANIGNSVLSGNGITDASPIVQPAYSMNSGSYTLYV